MNRMLLGTRYAAVVLLGLLAGCQSSAGTGALLGSEEATPLPGIKVDLPPPPNFDVEGQPTQYSDGTVSVYGLRRRKNRYLSKEVTVKAHLLEVYQCRRCPKGQTCKLCDQPHFFLADSPNGEKEKALLVADYVRQHQQPPSLTVGKQYNVSGVFTRSAAGFADSDGLLQFIKMVDDSGKEFMSPAAKLELKLQKDAEKAGAH
jgi:hypothetical protein